MFERPKSGERAILVHLDLQAEAEREDLEEFKELAISAGAVPIAVVTGSRKIPEPKYFVGTGKAEDVRLLVEETGAEVVLVNHPMSPAQERNLERLLKCRVLDRTGLILDIFAQRARSYEGKLQVELAQLRHLSTRLVRGWTHLERQKGGIGLRGPGETQLETDRRLLDDRVKQLNRRLERVVRQREQNRRARSRADIPTVSLVGYTNAGKSTLFNCMTSESVLAADQLFATLDPTLRRVALPHGIEVVLADTVGFIRHLPHDLVAAFRSTLQETREADLLLHVIDVSDVEHVAKMNQVHEVLREIGADAIPRVEIYNKIDRMEGLEPHAECDAEGRATKVFLSAASGEGTNLLRSVIGDFFRGETIRERIRLPHTAGRLRARLYELGAVRGEAVEQEGEWLIDVELKPESLASLRKSSEFAALLPRG